MVKAVTLATAFAVVALPLWASDGVLSEGKLSDRDFFRLATCGAPPGGACDGPVVRWPKAHITLGIATPNRRYPPALAAKVSAAIDRAIGEINASGAGLRILRDDRLAKPDILVSLPALSEGDTTRGIQRIPNGLPIGVGFMWLLWDANDTITEASMLISQDISEEDLPSVALEELFQCLGFIYDIENRYYEGRSILSQDSNATTTLAGQDRMILHRLYP